MWFGGSVEDMLQLTQFFYIYIEETECCLFDYKKQMGGVCDTVCT